MLPCVGDVTAAALWTTPGVSGTQMLTVKPTSQPKLDTHMLPFGSTLGCKQEAASEIKGDMRLWVIAQEGL
jgi:hypothetical protein